MLVPHDMNGQTVGVLGLGGSGIAAVAALQAAGAHVVAFDDDKNQQDLPAIQMTDWRDWPVAPIGQVNCRKIMLVFFIIKGNDMRTSCLQCGNSGNTGPAKT